MNTRNRLTVPMLRRIAAEHGLAHAEFRIGEHAGQVGLDRCAALYRELERLIGRIEHEMLPPRTP